MTIKRTIDGKEHEFVLTSGELFDAYCEQEHIWDADYVGSELSEELEEFCVDEADRRNIANAIAYEMRRQIDRYEMSSECALEEAFNEIKKRRESGELQPVSNSLNEAFVKDNLDAILGAQ